MLFLISASLKEILISDFTLVSEDLVFKGGSVIIPAGKTSTPQSSGDIQGSSVY